MKVDIFKTNTWKTFIWFFGNATFALSPLLLMLFLDTTAPGKTAASLEINNAMKSGAPFFVATALMGAAVIDLINEEVSFTGFRYFASTISPFVVMGLNLLNYTLVVCHVYGDDFYSSGSYMNIFTILFSAVYCLLTKYYLYKNGGLK